MRFLPRFLLACLLVAGVAAGAQAQSVDDLAAGIEVATEEVQRLGAEFERLREVYLERTAIVAALKDDSGEGLFRTMELAGALAQAQETADALMALDERIRSEEAGIRERIAALHEAVRLEIAEVERSVLASGPAGQAEAIGRLNELARLSARFGAPTQVISDIPIGEIVGAQDSTPEELLASADELRDHEDRIARQLDELEARLGELETRQRLVGRAREFAREEAFFEEGNGARFRPRTEEPQGRSEEDDSVDPTLGEATGGARGEQEAAGVEDAPSGPAPEEAPRGGDSEFGGAWEPPSGTPSDPEPGGDSDGEVPMSGDAMDNDQGVSGGGAPEGGGGSSIDELLGSEPDRLPADFAAPGADPTLLQASPPTGELLLDLSSRDLSSLRALRRRLQADLETIRAERQRLVREAEALDERER